MTHSIIDNGFNLIGLIAQGAKCFGHSLVDDLEITTACQLLELHQSKIWLNSRGVAIHHQTNGASWGNHSGLSVAVAMGLTQFNGLVPSFACSKGEIFVREIILIQRHW